MKRRLIAAAVAAAAVLLLAASTPYSRRLLRLEHRASPVAGLPEFQQATTTVRGAFNGRTFTDDGREFRYQLFFPRDYDPARKWPVIVALHGSAEKGDDGVQPLGVGVGKLVRGRSSTFPAIVLLPQVPNEGKVLSWTPAFMRLIDSVVRQVHGDPDRLYLTGLSMGGILAYDMAYQHPGTFAALVTVSAPVVIQPTEDRASRWPSTQSHPAMARALAKTPVWIFQGVRDAAAPSSETRHLVGVLQAAGVPVKYTEYADGAHDVWDRAYATPDLWTWLLTQRR